MIYDDMILHNDNLFQPISRNLQSNRSVNMEVANKPISWRTIIKPTKLSQSCCSGLQITAHLAAALIEKQMLFS